MSEITKIFVTGLRNTNVSELRKLFEGYGVVVECDMVNRCGFVFMETPSVAKNAIDALNNTNFKGNEIKVELGRPKAIKSVYKAGSSNRKPHGDGTGGNKRTASANRGDFQDGTSNKRASSNVPTHGNSQRPHQYDNLNINNQGAVFNNGPSNIVDGNNHGRNVGRIRTGSDQQRQQNSPYYGGNLHNAGGGGGRSVSMDSKYTANRSQRTIYNKPHQQQEHSYQQQQHPYQQQYNNNYQQNFPTNFPPNHNKYNNAAFCGNHYSNPPTNWNNRNTDCPSTFNTNYNDNNNRSTYLGGKDVMDNGRERDQRGFALPRIGHQQYHQEKQSFNSGAFGPPQRSSSTHDFRNNGRNFDNSPAGNHNNGNGSFPRQNNQFGGRGGAYDDGRWSDDRNQLNSRNIGNFQPPTNGGHGIGIAPNFNNYQNDFPPLGSHTGGMSKRGRGRMAGGSNFSGPGNMQRNASCPNMAPPNRRF